MILPGQKYGKQKLIESVGEMSFGFSVLNWAKRSKTVLHLPLQSVPCQLLEQRHLHAPFWTCAVPPL